MCVSCLSASGVDAIVCGISWAHGVVGSCGRCNSGLVVFSEDGLKRANSGPLVRRCLVTKADV